MTDLLISKKILLPMAIFGVAALVMGTFFKISHYSYQGINANMLLLFANSLGFFVWIVIIIDVAKNNIKNKILWIIFLVIFGYITSLIYLINRDKMLGIK